MSTLKRMLMKEESRSFLHLLVVSLVVLIPLIASVNAVEVSRLSRSIFILPVIAGCTCDIFFKVEEFFFLIQLSLSFSTV